MWKFIMDFLVNNLGSTVFLPIIILILGLLLQIKFSKIFRAAVTIGVGFIGLGLVISLLIGALDPATRSMIARFPGIHLVSMDVGWGVAAAIAFGTIVGALIIPLAFGVNIVMLAFRWTKTLNVDVWNYWHYAFTGSLVYIVTKSLPLALVAAVIHEVYALKMADLTAKQVQETFNLPGISIPQGWAVTSVPIVLGINWIIDKIPGVNKLEADPDTIKRKLGIIGEPMILGLLLGLIFGIIAYWGKNPDWRIWVSDIFKLSMSMAAVMLLIPRIIAIFMEGLTSVSEGAKSYLQRKFPGREFYIGLDSAILIGHPITIAASLLLIPITILLAAILPGNTTLPLADLAAMAFFVSMATPLTKGNLIRTVIIGIFIMIVVLYTSSSFAPLLTQTARSIGYAIPSGATQITALSGGNWVAWVLVQISKLFAR
jgi:PTS system galactitol-specific IIC component